MIAPNALQSAELRLAKYYAEKLRQTTERYEQGGASLPGALKFFDQELAQIRHWQGYIVEQENGGAEYDRLRIDFALNTLVTHQSFDQQMDWVQPGLEAAQRLGDHRSESVLLKDMSYILLRQGDLPAARTVAERAFKLAQQVNDKMLEADTILRLGLDHIKRWRFRAC